MKPRNERELPCGDDSRRFQTAPSINGHFWSLRQYELAVWQSSWQFDPSRARTDSDATELRSGVLCERANTCSKAAHRTRTIARATLHAMEDRDKAVSSSHDMSSVAVA